MVEYKRDLLALHPDFEQTHWLKRMFLRRVPKDLRQREVELVLLMAQNRLYFELLDFLHVYKNPMWFMTMGLTIFASHMMWVLLFLALMLGFLYLQVLRARESNKKSLKIKTKMSDVKVHPNLLISGHRRLQGGVPRRHQLSQKP